jgi:hypothetical protein
LARITACGQTSTHFPHWMQMSGSHTGISLAMPRFSHRAVPVGKVPSAGSALTGSASPSPAISRAVTCCTKGGASGGTGGRRSMVLVASAGKSTSWRWPSAASTAAQFRRTTAGPRLP